MQRAADRVILECISLLLLLLFVYAERILQLETAFEMSEFRQLVREATDDSLNSAVELFNVPGAVDVTLRGRPSTSIKKEVG